MDTIRTHWYADDLLKQYPSKGDKYVIDEELQHTDRYNNSLDHLIKAVDQSKAKSHKCKFLIMNSFMNVFITKP